jgi:hypothetical protein
MPKASSVKKYAERFMREAFPDHLAVSGDKSAPGNKHTSKTLSGAVRESNGLFSRVRVDLGDRTDGVCRLAVQLAVSVFEECDFPKKGSVYCYLIDLTDEFEELADMKDRFESIWWSDYWVSLGVDDAEIDGNLNFIIELARTGLPLFVSSAEKRLVEAAIRVRP